LLALIYKDTPERQRQVWDGVVEWYCLLNLALGTALGVIFFDKDIPILWDFAFFWAFLRVSEIIIAETDVVLLVGRRYAEEQLEQPVEWRRPNTVRSHRRLIVLLLMNLAEICIWFTFIYRAKFLSDLCSEVYPVQYCTFLDYVYLSLYTMGNLSAPDALASVDTSKIWLILQPAATFVTLLLTLATFVSYLPRPEPEDPGERWEYESR